LQAKHLSIIYHMIRRGKFSPLPSIYSKDLQGLQHRMMARDPADRPSCAEILQEEFLRWVL
jgi:serine/threonine protein kinase